MVGVIGEGEDVLVSLIDGTDIEAHRVVYKKAGKVITGKGSSLFQ